MDTFSTADIGLATVLQTVGFKFQGLDKSNPESIRFLFGRNGDLEGVIALHYQNDLKLSSLALLNNFRTFKHLVHQP